ncbi:MAG: hypothetical protein HY321_00850, partial [Armatimonadetes bacterium]|nr:hypothetical protein [Armatimonadota bacterium]
MAPPWLPVAGGSAPRALPPLPVWILERFTIVMPLPHARSLVFVALAVAVGVGLRSAPAAAALSESAAAAMLRALVL